MNPSVLRRLLPVAILLAGLALFLLLGLERYFSFDMLSRHQAALIRWVVENKALAAIAFVLIYAAVVAFSLPVAVLITPVGGFLFGVWMGAALSVIGATLGSIAVFLAARTAFRDLFRKRAGAALARLEAGFHRDDFSYLLFLRLVPVFPFWLINIVPALLGMRLDRYVLATLIGILPAAIVYSSLGAGLGAVIDSGEGPDLGIIFEWHILLPLLGLAVLALLPVVYSHLRDRRTSS
jgi:uncharacterized membrane protein YdjX (TVP38/TMEM64 family)